MLSALLVACNIDTLLDVPDPDVATPASVATKAALPAVLAGAIGDFMVAYNGTGDGQISMSGLFTDELIWAETFPTRYEVDVRSIQNTNTTMEGVFRNLHRARISASRAATGYASLDATNVVPYAEALALEGYTYIYFGENYCNGVAFSRLDEAGAPVYGSSITSDEAFAEAVVRFDSALTLLGATTNNVRYLAQVGKGRALLNRGQFAAAAAAVAGVPTNFSYNILHSSNTSRQNNGLWSLVFEGRRFGVGQLEGTNGLPFRAEGDTAGTIDDPRVINARLTGTQANGFDGTTALYSQLKYPLRDSPTPVATGAEARLIEAEASLQAGTYGNAGGGFAILQALRTGSLAALPFADPGTAAGREDQLFKERAYWMFLTSHRLGDMRRLVRQYGRAATSVFPSGAYFKGGLFGTDLNFPIPFDEQNNPNFQQCIDRNA
jgi:starch-binding outer membrane protein, SusD/RagB family